MAEGLRCEIGDKKDQTPFRQKTAVRDALKLILAPTAKYQRVELGHAIHQLAVRPMDIRRFYRYLTSQRIRGTGRYLLVDGRSGGSVTSSTHML